MINKRRKKIYVTNFRQSASKEDKQKNNENGQENLENNEENSIRRRDLIEQETYE